MPKLRLQELSVSKLKVVPAAERHASSVIRCRDSRLDMMLREGEGLQIWRSTGE